MDSPGQFPTLSVSPTLEPLCGAGGDVCRTLERLSSMGFRHVQLSATHRGFRPREMDGSARRELASMFRRLEMTATGLDLWIPTAHLLDPAHVDRAVDAIEHAIRLAADLGRVPLSFVLPFAQTASSGVQTAAPAEFNPDSLLRSIAGFADHHGIALADHSVPRTLREGIGTGIDPPAWLAVNRDLLAELPALLPDVISARLADLLKTGMRGPIGDTQHARLDAITYHRTLAGLGFRKPVVADARQWLDPWAGLQQTVAVWNAAFEWR